MGKRRQRFWVGPGVDGDLGGPKHRGPIVRLKVGPECLCRSSPTCSLAGDGIAHGRQNQMGTFILREGDKLTIDTSEKNTSVRCSVASSPLVGSPHRARW